MSGTRIAAIILTLCLAGIPAGAVDHVYLNGNVRTMDAAAPQAQAFVVRDGRFLAVGSDEEALAAARSDAQRHDLAQRTVLPGLIDAHGHLLGLGRFGLGRLDLSGARDFDEVCAEVAKAAAKNGTAEWVLGGRWDHESWPGKQLPTNARLSELLPDTPVWLKRVDGHAGIANGAALQRAGIDRHTQSPPGGTIVRDAQGQPTGLLIDRAMELIERRLPDPSSETAAALLKAQEMCFKAGLTSVHDAGVSPDELAIYTSLSNEGKLRLRVYAMVNGAEAASYFERHPPFSDGRLSVRAAKFYADGALGSRGAWLLAPYSDRATDENNSPYRGLILTPPDDLARHAQDALKRGYQMCVHAIGDAANHAVLNAVENATKAAPHALREHRFRVEHAQVVATEEMPRFARLGVIASIQPTHCTSDMRWAHERLGEARLAGAYAWKSLRTAGARLCGGSDFPVESHEPWLGIYAAVTRQTIDGNPPGGWRAEECLTREEAVRLFTTDAAYAAFAEQQQGRIAPGLFADFVVVDRDVLVCPATDIPQTRVLQTVVAGEPVYVSD